MSDAAETPAPSADESSVRRRLRAPLRTPLRGLLGAASAVVTTLVAMPVLVLLVLAVVGPGVLPDPADPGLAEAAGFALGGLLLTALTVLTAGIGALVALQRPGRGRGPLSGARSWLTAVAALPRLLPSLAVVGVVAGLGFYYWNLTSPLLLLAVVVHLVRRRSRGVLRRRDALALGLVVPGVLVAAALALGLALVVQSSTRPGSVRTLWRRARAQLREHPRASVASWAVTGAASFAVGQLGLRLLDQLSSASGVLGVHTEVGIGALAVILLAVTGVVLVLVPAAASAVAWIPLDAAPGAPPRDAPVLLRGGWLRWRATTAAQTALVVAVALVATQAHVLGSASSAEASSLPPAAVGGNPSSIATPATGLLAHLSVTREDLTGDGASELVPHVTAHVRDELSTDYPLGSVQFTLDGAPLGAPVAATPSPYGTDTRASVFGYAELSYGTHVFGCTFTSADGTRTQDCIPESYTARYGSSITVACTAGRFIGDPGTVTATVTAPADTTGTPPTGTVTIRSETQPVVTFPVVAGTGSHDFAVLPDHSSVTFTSDTHTDSRTGLDCGRDPNAVTTSPTVTSASLATGPYALGDALPVRAVVNATGSGPDQTPTGSLVVTATGTQGEPVVLRTVPLPLPVVDIPVPTGVLLPGSWTLTLRYVSDSPHYTDSQAELPVELGRATAALTPDPIAGNPGPFNTSGTWGTPLVAGGTLTSSADGPVAVRLHSIDAITGTEEVAALQEVQVTSGTAAYSFDLARVFTPRQRQWYVSAAGSALRVEARTATRNLGLSALASTTTFELSPVSGRIGVQIAIGSASSTAPKALGTATVFANHQEVGTVPVRDGVASLQYYPRTTAVQDVRVEFSPHSSQGYLKSAAGPVSFTAAATQQVGDPEVTWVRADLERTTLRLQYRPAAQAQGGPVPQAAVQVHDGMLRLLGEGTPDSDGALTLTFAVAADQLQLFAVYAGDAYYAGSTSALPLVPIATITPVVTLSADTTVRAGTSYTATASVAGVATSLIASAGLEHVGTVTTTTLFTRTGDGVQSTFGLGPVQLPFGDHQLRAVVHFTTASGLPPAYSALLPVRATLPAPTLVADLRSEDFTQNLIAGRPMTLTVTTDDPANEPSRLNADSPVRVYDTDGTLLATGTFGAPSRLLGSGPASTIPLALTGGEHHLLIAVDYGPGNVLTATLQRTVSVAPPLTSLTIEPEAAGVGTATSVDVVLDNHQGGTTLPAGLHGTLTHTSAGTDPVTTTHALDFRVDQRGAFRARVTLAHPHAGTEQLRAQTSETLATRAVTAAGSLHVTKRATALVGTPVSRLASGDGEVRVSASVVQGTQSGSSPLPTGTVVVNGPSGSCSFPVGGACTLQGQGFSVGSNVLRVHYPGDDDNESSSTTVGVTVDPQRTEVSMTFDPPVAAWVRGTHVRATWTATASASVAKGIFVLGRDGTKAVFCSGGATGECTFRAPDDPERLELVGTFTSATDAPSAETRTYPGMLSSCLPVRLPVEDTVVTVADGRPCEVPTVRAGVVSAGYTEGTALNIAHAGAAPQHYRVDWSTDAPAGTYEVLADRSLQLYVSAPTQVTYLPSYAPECVTLRWYPALMHVNRKQGYLTPITPPNCADPHRPTAADRKGLDDGEVRYVKGTRVEIAIAPGSLIRDAFRSDGLASAPTFRLVRINGSDFAPEGLLDPSVKNTFEVVMGADRTLDEVYAVRGCTPVEVMPARGGAVRITDARRPDSSRGLLPATGACTLPDGRPGYVPGTTLSLVAEPNTRESKLGAFVGGHRDGGFEELSSDGRRNNRRVADLNIVGGARWESMGYGGSLRYVVPEPSEDARVGAVFRSVACTPVVFHLAYPAHEWWRTSGARYDQVPDLGAQGCPGGWPYQDMKADDVVDETHLIPGKNNRYQQMKITRWVLAESILTPSVRPVAVRPAVEVSHTPEWSVVAAPGTPGRSEVSGYSTSAIDLLGNPAGVEIGVVWRSDLCAPMPTSFLKYPNGGKAAVVRHSGDPTCRLASDVAPGTIFAVVGQDRAGFQPHFASPQNFDSRGGGGPRPGTMLFYVPHMSSEYVKPLSVTMSYCRPLSSMSSLVGEDGKPVTQLSPSDAQLIRGANEAGPLYSVGLRSPHCPEGHAEPLSQVRATLYHGRVDLAQPSSQAGASDDRARQWGVVPSAPGAISVFVDANGVQTPTTLVTTARVRCHQVSLGKRVVFVTPPNCPGAEPSRFLEASTAQVQAIIDSDQDFNHWNGVDKDFGGGFAHVVVNGARSISADISTDSAWDKFVSGLSGVAVGFVAFVSQAASILVMAEVGILQTIASGASLLAKGLEAVGVSGPALQVFTGIATALNTIASFSQTLGGCVAAWNSGSSPQSAAAAALGGASGVAGGAASASGGAATAIAKTNAIAGTSTASALGVQLQKEADTLKNIRVGLDLGQAAVSSFGGNVDNYTAPPAEKWNGFASSMGSCIESEADKTYATFRK
jgi:hypothetical protein